MTGVPILTERLRLDRPRPEDMAELFARCCSDPEVTRYVGWRTHRSVDETRAFLTVSDEEWARWPAGPLLLRDRRSGLLLGAAGLHFRTPDEAATGYVLARDAWGRGLATEALQALVALARASGVRHLDALCHPDHRASWRVLEKCGFARAPDRVPFTFPNLGADPIPALRYVRTP